MLKRDPVTNRLLTIIAAVLGIAALRESYPVTMPVAVTVVIIAAVWPVKVWLDRAVPSVVSYFGTLFLLLALLCCFTAAVYFSTAQVVRAFAANEEQFGRAYSSLVSWASHWGIPELGGQEGYARLVSVGRTVLSSTYTVLAYLAFISVLVVLGLPEVPVLRVKIEEGLAPNQRELIGTVTEIAGKIRAYFGIATLTSVLTGVASAVWALVVGLDLALVWGALNFLLNYIPVVGNLLGIIPPTLYAVVQFQNWIVPAIVLAGFAVIQVSISNFIYPMLQGRSLSLSPVAIVVALAFWSWLWGVAGALIAVPLTAALVIGCEHFSSTRWIATALSTSRSYRSEKCR